VGAFFAAGFVVAAFLAAGFLEAGFLPAGSCDPVAGTAPSDDSLATADSSAGAAAGGEVLPAICTACA
jgi:hypothetical protein